MPGPCSLGPFRLTLRGRRDPRRRRPGRPSPWGAESLGFFAEFLASSRALSVFFGFALVSSLVLTVEAYVSTYSCPDSRMISYMISSVTDRSRKRSEGRPEYFEKSMGEPK